MIGDIILSIKKFWKQFICIHHYKCKITKDLEQNIYFECEKCEQCKNVI